MPYTNVHLRISKLLLENGFPAADRSAFLAGSIAPDAVHLKVPFTKQDKADAHLVCCWHKGVDKNIWRNNVLSAKKMFSRTDFGTGYALHLLTDVRWAERLDITFIERYDGRPEDYGKAYRTNMLACETELLAGDPMEEVYRELTHYKSGLLGCPVLVDRWIRSQADIRRTEAPKCRMYIETVEIERFIYETAKALPEEWNQW